MQRQSEGGKLDMVALFQDCYAKYINRHSARGDRPWPEIPLPYHGDEI